MAPHFVVPFLILNESRPSSYFYRKDRMACNCKKRLEKLTEYTDEPVFENEGGLIWKALRWIGHLIFGIIAFALIIVMLVPFLLYLLFCLMTGTEAHIRYTKNGIRFGKKQVKNGQQQQLQDKG